MSELLLSEDSFGKEQIHVALFYVIQTTNSIPWIVRVISSPMQVFPFCSFIAGHPRSKKKSSYFHFFSSFLITLSNKNAMARYWI